jgi:amino acid adenylation domain-containing protein/thioester reductase-like protein
MQEQILGFPLSPQQKRLWLLQQDSQSYQAGCAILLQGNLKVEVLEEALQLVVDRNEILRTAFHRTRGIKIPIQVIKSQCTVSLQELTLKNLNTQEIERIFDQASEQKLNFEKDSLCQTILIRLLPNQYVLVISLPSLCADRTALKNLLGEISRCYAACLQGEELLDEPLQYANLAEWQNELLEAEDTKAGREYWQKQDFSALETLKLPFENWSSGESEFAPQFLTLPIQENVRRIEAIAQKYQTSVSVFLLACWQILLWRLTEQSDVIVGMACDGRKYEELKEAIGLFTKYLPLHCEQEDNNLFGDILMRLNESAREIYARQEYFSWEEKVAYPSFLPFCFEFEEQPVKHSGGDVTFSIYKSYACIDRFKVKLSCVRQDDTLNAEFHYDGNVFSADDIKRLAEQFQTLLGSAIENAETAIAQLEIISDREKQQLLFEFNNTQTAAPKDKFIHHLFEAQVERTPNNIAVVFENQKLTYAELNARANQLAHYLQKLGVKPEVLVGLYLERSLEMLVAILAILKAGGAYVPLDPTYPKERLSFILADAQTPILLTQKNLAKELPTDGIKVVSLDTDWEIIAPESRENPASRITFENLAYVIYTSGSTGKPKGTLIHHQGLLNYLTWCTKAYTVEQGEGSLVHSSIAFDLTVTGLFSPLLVGRKVELLPQDIDIETIAATLGNRSNLSLVKITPAQLELLSHQLSPPEAAGRTRAFIIGGENLLAESIAFWQKYAPNTILINEYGPTETVVGCCIYQVSNPSLSGSIPIGNPIANTQLYVLDKYQNLAPIGVVGELHIGGAGLARGYLNRPELTAEKFIPHPFSEEPGARLYKTGDLARYRPDGTLEFLGRIDHQVKIRGFRIELGEIEAAILTHPNVQECVVLAREDVPGDRRLVAYVVQRNNVPTSLLPIQNLNPSDLRDFLKEKLPEYMVPSAYVMLKVLPLTPNGKVARQKLPAPEKIRPDLQANFVRPRTPIEKKLTEIWAEVLRVEQVGIYDNFFELGGHSLLVTQVLARVRKAFSIDLSLGSIFEAPTVVGMAERIEMGMPTESGFEISKKDAIAKCGVSRIALDNEAVLDPTIRPNNVPFELKTQPTAIFLTGVTGFFGAFLLSELLQQTEADIYCLVRSPNITEGKQKIQSTLQSYLLWNEHLSSRIIPVVGDLSEPLLGLSEREFLALAEQLDVIYHNGALVNFTYPYSALKAANVLGTEEILRLAAKIKLKPVHFISTTSVFSASESDEIRVVREVDEIDNSELIHDGYSQSKWVAEKLVAIAASRGIPVSIYRPGRISGHSKTGICNTNDHTFRTIKGCIQLGYAPNLDAMVNLTPVDYVSQAIAHLSKQQSSLGKAFHLVNPHSVHWNELVNWIRSMGYPLKQISYSSWQTEMLNIAENNPENALYPLASTFSENASDRNTKATLQFDCQNTLNGLLETSITCPPVNTQLISTYFAYLIRSGFLNAPTQEV